MDKKSIVIICYHYFPNTMAQTYCVQNIALYLAAKDYCVDIVSSRLNPAQKEIEVMDGITIHRVCSEHMYKFEQLSGKKAKGKLSKFFLKLVSKLYLIVFRFNQKYLPVRKTLSKVESIIKEHNVKMIFTVSAPFDNHILGYKIRKNHPEVKWIAYELDPFSFNYMSNNISLFFRKAKEIRTFKLADLIVSTDGILDENQKHKFRMKYDYKTHSLPMPNMHINENEVGIHDFENSGINLVYSGTFWKNFREPDPLLRVLKILKENKFLFHCFGCKDYFEKHHSHPHNTVLHDKVTKETCENILFSASALVNFGNKIPNQTPSKVFDYIASGKPIINFYYNKDDTSMHYLSKYPICLNIENDAALDGKIVNEFEKFCINNKEKRVPASELRSIYEDILSENVCKRFYDLLEGL